MKKILTLLMVVCLAVYVTGCSKDDDSADSTTPDLGNEAEMPGGNEVGETEGEKENSELGATENDSENIGVAEKEKEPIKVAAGEEKKEAAEKAPEEKKNTEKKPAKEGDDNQ